MQRRHGIWPGVLEALDGGDYTVRGRWTSSLGNPWVSQAMTSYSCLISQGIARTSAQTNRYCVTKIIHLSLICISNALCLRRLEMRVFGFINYLSASRSFHGRPSSVQKRDTELLGVDVPLHYPILMHAMGTLIASRFTPFMSAFRTSRTVLSLDHRLSNPLSATGPGA